MDGEVRTLKPYLTFGASCFARARSLGGGVESHPGGLVSRMVVARLLDVAASLNLYAQRRLKNTMEFTALPRALTGD